MAIRYFKTCSKPTYTADFHHSLISCNEYLKDAGPGGMNALPATVKWR
jgi:hypothetical protein